MGYIYESGLSQEDERTEAVALHLDSSDKVLSIASAGDMPLSLLALGAGSVDAVDIDPNQLHLLHLKAEAVRNLDREEAVGFLGFLPTPTALRRRMLQRVLTTLPSSSRRFWQIHTKDVEEGAIWAGRHERQTRLVIDTLLKILGRRPIEELFGFNSLPDQADYYERTFNTPRLRQMLRLAFHPRVQSVLRRGLVGRAMSIASNGDELFERFRSICTASLARDNHFLQLMVLGRVLSGRSVPAYLSEDGFHIVRRKLSDLHVHQSDLATYLRRGDLAVFDKAHLSNLVDWLEPRVFDDIMRLVVERASCPARVVWRYTHADRPLPADIEKSIKVDRALGAELHHTDRFPFYTIVPASIAR